MAELQEYKCPSCGGAIEFDSETQKMQCPYCGTQIDVAALEPIDEDLEDFDSEDELRWNLPGEIWQEGETEGMRIYQCKSCGGQIIGDETLGATKCPFCGNPVVMMGQFKGDLKPDCIIPFQLNREDAKQCLKNHLKGRTLLPKVFEAENHIDEIKGLYVPFWLFDARAQGSGKYSGTKEEWWSDSKYMYTETSYYSIFRSGEIYFHDIPVDGSLNMPADLMESLEPFDPGQAVEFQTAYLAGYLANRYDENSSDSWKRAGNRIKSSMEAELKASVSGYKNVSCDSTRVWFQDVSTRYALFPVWILNTTWQEQRYLFAMNGQTGKFVGNLPIDTGKLWLLRGLFFAIAAIIVYLFMYFSMREEVSTCLWVSAAIGAGVAFLITGIMKSGMKNVEMKSSAAGYYNGNIYLKGKQDTFLYKTLTSVPIDDGNKKGGGKK